MILPAYSVVLVSNAWEVRYAGRRDPDLTTAVRQAVGEKGMETQRKAARFLARFLNFRHRSGERHDAFIKEHFALGRMRIEALLRSTGFEVVYETNRIDGSCYVRGVKRSVSELPVWLAALSRLYTSLRRNLMRSAASPMKVDGWHRLLAIEKSELARTVMGPKARFDQYRGSQYISSGLAPSPLRIEDAVDLGPAVLEAGLAYGWPRSIQDLVTVMSLDGPRWADTAPLTAADWAKSSAFGRTLWAPNKTSKGQRVKRIVVTAEAVLQLRTSFDSDPLRSDMAHLEHLLLERRWMELDAIYLFPSTTGRPHTYGVYNNDYFRPAVEQAGLLIHGKNGSVRPTGHRLRAARIQAEIDFIYREGRSEEQIENDLAQLQRDVFIKNRKAFERYVGEKREERALLGKIIRFDAQQARNKESRAAGGLPPARRVPEKSLAQRRLETLQ